MIREAIAKLIHGQDLTAPEAEAVMQQIMLGEATPSQIGAFLIALRIKGETPEEIAACARVMRTHSIKVHAPQENRLLVDTCGTGGDGTGTFNVSTIAAFIVAGAGVPVAKHGNRSVSSRCGSADVLEALGAVIDLPPEHISICLQEAGIGFLFAPRLHPAMKYAAGPRREIGARTIFNVLGPLTNPASASVQLLGVYDPGLTELMARVLGILGVHSALVVHGHGGLDEISIAGPSRITRLQNGQTSTFELDPRELGIQPAPIASLAGGTPEDNARIAREVLSGDGGSKRDMAVLNAAAALMAAGTAPDLKDGMTAAAESIDSGKAMRVLDDFVALTRKLATAGSPVGGEG